MIAVALRNLRHRPGGFVATFLSAFLGAALIMAFASLLDTASGADAASNESLVTTAGVGGGWCLVIVAFAVTSTLTLAVRQREQQFALLRSVGATGPQLRRMIVGDKERQIRVGRDPDVLFVWRHGRSSAGGLCSFDGRGGLGSAGGEGRQPSQQCAPARQVFPHWYLPSPFS